MIGAFLNTTYPPEFAAYVHRQLVDYEAAVPNLRFPELPTVDALTAIFETMFWASLATEEGSATTFGIEYVDPQNPDPLKPPTVMPYRSRFTPLGAPLPFDVRHAVKLSRATDPRSTSIAVHTSPGQTPRIVGLVDQVLHYQDFRGHTGSRGQAPIGPFQARILGPGNVVVEWRLNTVAELRSGRLLGKPADPLARGEIRRRLQRGIDAEWQVLAEGHPATAELAEARAHHERYWLSTLARTLLRVRRFRHGGSWILTPEPARDIAIGYELPYPGLSEARRERSKLMLPGASPGLSRNERFYGLSTDQDARVDGASWFVALLSRVDGCTVLNPSLDVFGFGAVIQSTPERTSIHIESLDLDGTPRETEVPWGSYGTRHQSMQRFCLAHPDCLGFVVSQDGDVRVMLAMDGEVHAVENIRLEVPYTARYDYETGEYLPPAV